MKNWVDHDCMDFNFIELKGNKITTREWANVFGAKQVKGQHSFKAKFTKMSGFVSVGVIDTLNKDKDWKSWNKNKVYYISDGRCQFG